MAGMAGQPSPKPSAVNAPVPGATQASVFDSAEPAMAKSAGSAAGNTNSVFDQGGSPPAAAPSAGYTGPGAGAIQTVADWMPAVGGVAGAVAGLPADIPTIGGSSVGGAMVGGAAGQTVKRAIEIGVLGKPIQNTQDELINGAIETAKQGLNQYFGLKFAQGIAGAVESKLGGAMIDKAAGIAATPIAYMKNVIGSAYDQITSPVLKLIADNSTHLNTEQAGDAVKGLFQSNIQGRFGKFVNSYADLDAVAKSVPLSDETRLGFTTKLKDWALDNGLGGDNYKMVQKYANDFNDAENGKQFSDIIQQLNSKATAAAQDGMRNQASAFRLLRDKAEDFMEQQTMGLAKKIQTGNASPDEMGFLQQMMQQRGITEDDPAKYAKSLANDYLGQRDVVKGAYAKFRSFLEDVGEQTRTNPEGRGPIQFLKDIQDVPSEKLIERMFDPKNAAALRSMEKETPEIFEQVAKSKMSQIVQKSSPDGSLDLMAFRREMNKLPESTRSFLMDSKDMAMMNKTLADPKLLALQKLESSANAGIIDTVAKVAQMMHVAAPVVAKDAATMVANSPLAKQAIGSGVRAAGSAAIPPLLRAYGNQPSQSGSAFDQ